MASGFVRLITSQNPENRKLSTKGGLEIRAYTYVSLFYCR